MVHTGIFATSAEITAKAGENYDTTFSESMINSACAQAESIINVACQKNFSDAYASLNADVKGILSAAEASWVAMQIINYNMRNYTSRYEANTMLNVLRDEFQTCLGILKDAAKVDYMVGA